MSAFLGPVHHWMYGKIQLQEELTAKLLTLSTNTQLSDKLNEKFGKTDNRPLEEIIDQSNIHGWLNARVQRAEQLFASVVRALLEKEKIQPERLNAVAKEFGKEHAIAKGTNISAAYEEINNILLDGMPCDGGRNVVSEDADDLIFQYDLAVHALCNTSGGAAAFIALRTALLNGLLENSGIKTEMLSEGVCRLYKEG